MQFIQHTLLGKREKYNTDMDKMEIICIIDLRSVAIMHVTYIHN